MIFKTNQISNGVDKTTLLLCLILGLAIFVRFWGIDYGLPYFLIDDERALVYSALKMAELKTLIPAFYPDEFDIMNYKYNFLMSYIYLIFLVPFILIQYLIGSFSDFAELASYFILNPGTLWLIARITTALIGVATVYLIYLIGRKIFNNWVGLLSALFLTLSFLNIQFSHFARPWSPMVFFTCLIMLLSAYIYKSPQRKHYLWMGLALGLGFGVSSATSVVIVIFFLAHFILRKGSFLQKIKSKDLWLSLIIFLFLSLIFIFLSPQGLSAILFGGNSLTTAKSVVSYFQGFISYLKVLLFYEPVILIFFLVGLAIFWFKSKKIFFVALFWPVFYISSLYFLSYVEFTITVTRYIILIIPWLIIAASFAVYHFVSIFKHSLIKTIIIILVFVCPFATALRYSFLLDQKDTRVLALEWVEENIPAGASIISNWSYVNPTPTKEAILLQKQLEEGSLRIADLVLLDLNDKDYPKPSYDVLKFAYMKEKILPDKDYQYLLTAPWEEEAIMQEAQLIKEFKQGKIEKAENINADFIQPISILFLLERLGPTVRIYEFVK